MSILNHFTASNPMSLDPSRPALAATTGNSKKRSRDELIKECMPDITLPGEEDEDEVLTYDMTCDDVRKRITAFLNAGEMKVTEFQRMLNINSNSYGRFMKLKGPYSGRDNQTYDAAYLFFKKRDLAGIKTHSSVKRAKTADLSKYDFTGIHLDGEEDDDVPIYDTPADIRNKINAVLRDSGMTQAELARRFAQQVHHEAITGGKIKRFIDMKGPFGGAANPVYYAAFVFFEKLRIKTGGKESKKRLELMDVHPDGIPRRDLSRGWIVCRAGQVPTIDSLGRTGYHVE